MKKILTILLALAMLASGVAVAEGASNEVDFAAWGVTLPIVDQGEKVTLRIAVPQSAENYDADKVWFWKWASGAMNISFDVEQIPSESVEQRKNLMFASGDLPDIIYGVGFSTADLVKYGQYEKQLLPVNRYLNEEVMPHLTRWSSLTSFELCVAPDGNQYVLPYIDRVVLNDGNGHPLYINKELTAAVGKQMPTTVEELTELLRAFKAAYPDMIPMGGSALSVNYIMVHLMNAYGLGVSSDNPYGVSPAMRRSADIVVPCATPEYKEYLTTMNTWFREGLISQDFFTMDRATDMAQAAEGKYAAWCYPCDQVTQDPEIVHRYQGVINLLSATNDVISVPAPVRTRPGNAVIAANTEHPETCAKFLDFFYSPVGMVYGWYGPMAGSKDTLGMVEGWYVDPETMVVNYKDVENGAFTSSYTYAIGVIAPCSGARLNNCGDYNLDLSKYGSHAAIQLPMAGYDPVPLAKNPDLLNDYPLWTIYSTTEFRYAEKSFYASYTYMDEETSIAVSDLKTVIRNYVETETARFVTGARSLDEFDSYLAELEKMNVDEYLGYYTALAEKQTAQ